jgi:hypothetical protein
MYRVGCLFDKSAHPFVDLPATKAILNGIQADLSFTRQISSADSSNSQSVMPEYIRPRSIQGPDKGDRHGWGVEKHRPCRIGKLACLWGRDSVLFLHFITLKV